MTAPNAEQLEDIASEALECGEEEAALAQLLPAAKAIGNARLWQFAGLLQRSLDRHSDALRSFATAAKLAPADPSIAHGYARVALEAGIEAVPLFEAAVRLAPSADVLLGLTAARFASGQGATAADELESVLNRSPLWVAGHQQLAQLRSMLGERDRSTESLERALAQHPQSAELWMGLFDLAIRSSDFAALAEAAARAPASLFRPGSLQQYQAIAAAELKDSARAGELFDALPNESLEAVAVWHVRHLISAGKLEEAVALIDAQLEGDRAAQFWPYAHVAWRLAEDPRAEWLDAGGTLVSTCDLSDEISLSELAARLRAIHVARGEYLDQSVRGGTQTDGPLLSRIDPEIQRLRSAIVGAVEQYLGQLPTMEPRHPLLRERRDRRIRFSGSWSVRLRGSGHHVSHVHPQGWISSALYVALPDHEPTAPNAGWLQLGQPPPSLGFGLPPLKLVEPRPGHLVLFPSWMWHGTIPFDEGERLSVAFDVRPPK